MYSKLFPGQSFGEWRSIYQGLEIEWSAHESHGIEEYVLDTVAVFAILKVVGFVARLGVFLQDGFRVNYIDYFRFNLQDGKG